MTALFLVYFLTLCGISLGRNALDNFIKHKRVKNITIEVLKSLENNTNDWIEYKYFFSQDLNTLNVNRSLKVGLRAGKNSFDCTLPTKTQNQIKFQGYSNDVVNSIQDNLKIRIEKYQLKNKMADNLTVLVKNELDILICHLHTTDLLEEITELYPIIKTSMLLVYQPENLKITKDIFILTIAGWLRTWTAFFATLLLLALFLRFSTKRYSQIPPKHESWSWVEITLWVIAASCQQGLSKTPNGFACCCIFFLGYLMAYLLYTALTAAITSILVQHDIGVNTGLERLDLGELELILLESSRFFVGGFKEQFLTAKYVNNLDELFAALDSKNKIGIAPEIYLNQFMANNLNYEQFSGYVTQKLDIKYKKGFLISRNNPWRKKLNKEILMLDQSGILQNMLKRNLKPVQILDLNTGYSSAGIEHVGSAILLLLCGIVAAILFLFAEFLFYFYRKGRKKVKKMSV